MVLVNEGPTDRRPSGQGLSQEVNEGDQVILDCLTPNEPYISGTRVRNFLRFVTIETPPIKNISV